MLLKAYIAPHPPIILPEVGKGREIEIQNTIDSMEKIGKEISLLKPETIIISSPHAPMFRDGFYIFNGEKISGDLKSFGISNVEETIECDIELSVLIAKEAGERKVAFNKSCNSEIDHGSLIPLRFIKKYYTDFKLVIVGLSGLSEGEHFQFGKNIKKSIHRLKRKAVFIASGDLSHVLKSDGPYGFEKEGPEFDEKIVEIIKMGDLKELYNLPKELTDKASQCGLKSFQILGGLLDDINYKSELYSYEGPFGVGYCVAGIEVEDCDDIKIDPYVDLATKTIHEYVKKGKIIPVPDNLPNEMTENRAGVFVTIYKNGELRGCIGTISPRENSIASEIISNAISSSTSDPRFPEVKPDELSDLVISVDVLHEPEQIDDIEELDVKKYGVIVKSGYRKGLLLPNLEGVNDIHTQIQIALKKAGIGLDESFILERFEVIRHE